MKKILYIAITLALASCNTEQTPKDNNNLAKTSISHTDIEKIEKELFNDKNKISEKLKTELNDAYLQFVKEHPEDEMCPEYLFRAANIARSQQNYNKAIQVCKEVIEKYPNFKSVDAVHFFIAFVYDNDIQDKSKASSVYNDVAKKYPNTQFGKDAKARLKTIHLSDEELIEFFEKNNSPASKL